MKVHNALKNESNFFFNSLHFFPSGALRDSLGAYDYAFYLTAACMFFSGILFVVSCLLFAARKRRKKKGGKGMRNERLSGPLKVLKEPWTEALPSQPIGVVIRTPSYPHSTRVGRQATSVKTIMTATIMTMIGMLFIDSREVRQSG